MYTNVSSNIATNNITTHWSADESTFYWQTIISTLVATNFPTVYCNSNGSANTSTDWAITATDDEYTNGSSNIATHWSDESTSFTNDRTDKSTVYWYTNIFSNFATHWSDESNNFTTDRTDESTFNRNTNDSSNFATNNITTHWSADESTNFTTDRTDESTFYW